MRRNPAPLAILATALAASLAPVPGTSARAEDGLPPAPVTLEAPSAVGGLVVEDGDGDGIPDVFVVEGREVRGFRGVRGAGPAAAPTWTFTVPPDATFVDVAGPVGDGAERTASCLALASGGVVRLVPGRPPAVEEGFPAIAADVTSGLSAGEGRAVFSDLVRGRSLLLPAENGLAWLPDRVGARSRSLTLAVPLRRTVSAAGPFLGDVTEVVEAWPDPILRPAWAAAGGRDAAVMLGPDGVHALVAADEAGKPARDLLYPTGFLPGAWDRRLVDLDADGVPDLCHEATTNKEGTYAFFRVPPPRGLEASAKPPDAPPPAQGDLRPARGLIRLTGFQLPPEYPDLDGDGRPDFVVTTIEIDAKNLLRAIRGSVTARTRAFRNRSAASADPTAPSTAPWFLPTPDAEVDSDVSVRILFSYTGAIEVRRSFTILPTGDLDGDRRKDLAIRTAKDELSVWRGGGDRLWEAEPRKVRIPPMGDSPDLEARAADLSGDGKDDLLLLYRGAPGAPDRLVVLVSP